MPFIRPNKWILAVDERQARWEERQYVCAEFVASRNGEGYAHFWIEKHHPETVVETPEGLKPVNGHVERFEGPYVQTMSLIEDKDGRLMTDAPPEKWMLREYILALAADDVRGRSAQEMVWSVCWQAVLKDPQADLRWVEQGAPEWLKRVKPEHTFSKRGRRRRARA